VQGWSQRPALVDYGEPSVERGANALSAAPNGTPPADQAQPKREQRAMTAELFRTVSTCVAAIFVSTMLVTAATAMPALL
jgi:hypothetical protein